MEGIVQTYKTHVSPVAIARNLDDRRLTRQIDEALQVFRIIDDPELPGQDHPAVRMWRDRERALITYMLSMCHEWRIERGNTSDDRWAIAANISKELREGGYELAQPVWERDVWVMRSHRSRLIAKSPRIYAERFGDTPENMPYLWPQPVKPEHDPRGYRLRLSDADERRVARGQRQLPEDLYWDPNKREVLVHG